MLIKRLLAAILFACLLAAPVRAAESAKLPFLHPLFTDHAVLQRNIAFPVWGWTTPGAKVTVSLNGKTAEATAGADGRWQARIGPFSAGGPYTLQVTGPQSVTCDDILIGDVWICSGQSNMEFGIANCNMPNEIASANYPEIRLLTVPKLVAFQPVKTIDAQWLRCTPENIMKGVWGGFSACGYFFGREIYQQTHVPIGLIHTSWGGTIAEAWTSTKGLAPLHDFDERVAQVQKIAEQLNAGTSDVQKQLDAYYVAHDPGTAKGFFKPDADTAGWQKMSLPQKWEDGGFGNYDGIGWFRKEFDLPQAWAGKDLTLSLGPIDDIDTTFVNGVAVGSKDVWLASRDYRIPAKLLKPGRNVIAIRVLDTGGNGGLYGNPDQLHVGPNGAQPISLAGEWLCTKTTPMSQLPPLPGQINTNNPNVTTVLYNGMISPLLPFAIKGAIWYQGESNAGRAYQYRDLLPAMIKDWRSRFGVGDFPFYIVSLAAFTPAVAQPRDNDWAELREAQAMTAKDLPNCGLAIAIDIGDAGDIHPKDKLDVGKRLAYWALAKDYGKKITFSGPWYKSMEVDGNKIRLHFDYADGGLVAHGNALKGFAIAGADHKFVWADATIDGDTIVVSSPDVDKPVAVRYAWDENPICNLYNKAGLPAVPFRTDDWAGVTVNNK